MALLIALVVAYQSYRHSEPASAASFTQGNQGIAERTAYRPPTAKSTGPTVTTTAAETTASSGTPASATKAAPTKASAATRAVRLSLAAARGNCWVEVRSSSSKGKVLYVGTLLKGKSFKLVVSKLWIRFGAPENIQLELNGKVVTIPSGTLDVLVTPTGIKPAT